MDLTTIFTIIGVVIAILAMFYGIVNQWTAMQGRVEMIIGILGDIKVSLIGQQSDIKALEQRVTRLEEHLFQGRRKDGE